MIVFEAEVNGRKQTFYRRCDPVILSIFKADEPDKIITFFGESDREAYEAAIYNLKNLEKFDIDYKKYEKKEVAFSAKYGLGANCDFKLLFISSLSLEELKSYIKAGGYKAKAKRTGISVRIDKAKTVVEFEEKNGINKDFLVRS